MSTQSSILVSCCLRSILVALAWVTGFSALPAHAQEVQPASTAQISVSADVALQALVTLSDGHLQKIADVFSLLAQDEAVQSTQWPQVKTALNQASRINVAALYWFALPDGSYWTLDEGRVAANLADRDYFPDLLASKTVMGSLVVSRATGKSVAIVAVPVQDAQQKVVGVLGASVYLDQLSQKITDSLRLAPNEIFYSLDATPIVGLHKDPTTIFVHPLEENDPQLTAAIREMLGGDQGTVRYRFRGKQRTILYQKSSVTGWWYGFGQVAD